MTNSDKLPERSVRDADQGTGKIAALIGCRPAEAEEIELLLDLLLWRVVRLENVAQLSESGAALAFVDSSLIELNNADTFAHGLSVVPVIGLLCDASEAAKIKTALTLDLHILVRPIDLQAVESIIRIAT